MTLKEYFEAGNEVYYFTEEEIEDLRARLEAWKRAEPPKAVRVVLGEDK